MNDLISIIVPIYKVEEYLDRCVESIVNQTYENLEIILVDDGSPDRCGSMCDEWAEKDSRIKVIHKKNGGLSDARNAGLDIAAGAYIAFVDSDDWIHSNYIKILYTSLIENNADVSACDIDIVDDNSDITIINEQLTTKVFDNLSAMQSLVQGAEFASNVWNKLYSVELLKNERFIVGKYHEDEFFSYRIISKINTAVFNNAKLYYYYQRSGSIMNSFSIKHLDMLEAYIERINFLEKNYSELALTDKKNFYISLVNNCCNALKYKNNDAVKLIKEHLRVVNISSSEIFSLNFKSILYILGAKINIKLFAKLLNFIHR